MFENLLREMKKLDGTKVSVPIEADEEGSYDREYPADNCKYVFKVNEEDWGNIFKDEVINDKNKFLSTTNKIPVL